MKKKEKEEIPILSIERNVFYVGAWLLVNVAAVYFTYTLFSVMNPWGFIVMVPAVVMSFLSLWVLLNPFAVFFDDKVEFRQTFFNNSILYYIDVKEVVDLKNDKLRILYNDDDEEAFRLYGIRGSHREILKSKLIEQVSASLEKRKPS